MTASPRLSIGVPVYNGERFIERALDSLSAQTEGDYEVLISDNASSDRTAEICADYASGDPRVRLWRHERNRGAAWNYNFTVAEASGTYFKWAAHDDEFAPTFLERCLAVFAEHPETTTLVYPRTLFIDEQSEVTARFLDNLSLLPVQPSMRLHRLLRVIARCNPVFGLIRTAALRRTGLIGPYVGSDKVLLAELCLQGRFREVPEYLFLRRMHAGISTAAAGSKRELLQWFDPEAGRLPALFSGTRLWLELLRAVRRADLDAEQRQDCLRVLWRQLRVRRAGEDERFRQKIAPVDTSGVADLLETAGDRFAAGEFDAALRACRQALDQWPWMAQALHLIAVVELRRGAPERALPFARAASWRAPRSAPAQNTLGVVEAALGHREAAVRAFESALALRSPYPEASANLASVTASADPPGSRSRHD